MTTKPPLQKILKEFCTQKMKANKTMKGQAKANHRRRKDKKANSKTDSTIQNQTLNQQRQQHDRVHHAFINTNTEC
jgi:hypothetical protein